MLAQLRIKDFAIIRDLSLEFHRGLMVFTGETGAGKSIIIDAVELLLGGRAESTVVRSGADTAFLEAQIKVDPAIWEPILEVLRREELIEAESEVELLLSREIRLEGRNICRVNGRIVALSVLRELGDLLVDVHGQSEHLSLLRVRHHLTLLDRFADLGEPLSEYRRVYRQLEIVRDELATLRVKERDAAQRADYLAFQIQEIEAAKLRLGEEEELTSERARLANAEKLAQLTDEATAALEEGLHGEVAATDLMGRAVESIAVLARIDASLEPLQTESQALLEQITDLASRLRQYGESAEFQPDRLDEVEERLSLLGDLKRKFGSSIEEVIGHLELAREELDGITHAEARIDDLVAEAERLRGQLAGLALALSAARRDAAEKLAEAVESELQHLNMGGAEFKVQRQWLPDEAGLPMEGGPVRFGPRGVDDIEFLIAPNPGEGLKPLVKVASGGETSRLMLGLKGVLAQADETPTLIFDEIDQGIGGRVGAIVGQKLWRLARNHQVLCVTHLPQLAAFGDRHFRVEKDVIEGRTETLVHSLDGERRARELASMLGGVSDPNLESAQALLMEADGARAQA
jgi:DNA repair protein RecN (Recombination protein N)